MSNNATGAKLLIVDDEPAIRVVFGKELSRLGYEVECTDSAEAARLLLETGSFDLVLLDVRMPGMQGDEFLRELAARDAELPVLILTGHANVDLAVQLMRDGARDLLTKPCSIKHLAMTIERALEGTRIRATARTATHFLRASEEPPRPIHRSAQMEQLLSLLARIAPTEEPVLIGGESGTGKELIAHEIRRASRRAAGPFIAVNCAAVSATLLESELFGHEKGAFSGAVERRIGLFEMADGGTIFLDEIGDMAPEMQAKLLRVLQSGEFWRVGGSKPLRTDARVIAASNRDLAEMARAGTFREDLLYRINGIQLDVPPLRQRPDDIEPLALHFLRQLPGESTPRSFTPEAIAALQAHRWPGNVRELRNVVRRAALLSRGTVLDAADLTIPSPLARGIAPPNPTDLTRTLEDVERAHILAVLDACGGNKAKAARTLGIAVKTIYNKLEAWGMDLGD